MINLQKNQTISLKKETIGNANFKDMAVGLGWDAATGIFGGSSIDCDASIALVSGHDKEIIYYGNKKSKNGAVLHQGDNLTGEGDGDDEQIFINFANIPSNVDRIVVGVNIYSAEAKRQHFGKIKNCFVRVFDKSNHTEVCKFNLSGSKEYDKMTAMILGEFIRVSPMEFTFKAVGNAYRVPNIKGMFESYLGF